MIVTTLGKIQKNKWLLVQAVALICFSLAPDVAKAFHIGVGSGGVEEGDDRLRPYVSAEVGLFDEFVNARVVAYGMKYSVVSQQSAIASLSVRPLIPIASSKRLYANVGAWWLREITKILATDNEIEQKETLTAYGPILGVHFKIIDGGSVYFSIDWDGHLYIPGSAFIALSTGRRQTLGLSFGVSL